MKENLTEPNYFNKVLTFTDQFGEQSREWIQFGFDFYRSIWGPSFFLFDVVGSMCLTVGCFWLIGSLYTFLDLFQWPKFLYKYKTQEYQTNINEIIETAKIVFINQMTVQLGTSVLFHFLTKFRSFDINYRVPTLGTIIYHMLVFILIQETTFYYLHRMLHYGKFYRYVHKIHHHWQAPIAISALHCHPIEHFLANLLPVLLGPVLMGSHRCTIAIWLIIVHIVTLNDHSGYHFPLMPSPEFHDYHHLTFNQNFGRMGFLDYLHGTSERYFKSKYCKRHQVLLSLTPMKILVPDSD